MSLAHPEKRTVGLLVALGLAIALAVTPTAAATHVAGLPHCESPSYPGECIVNALLGGILAVIAAIGLGIAGIFRAALDGFATFVISPFLRVFEFFFGGLGEGLANLGKESFSGAGDSFRDSYGALSSTLGFFGPFAPIVATLVILGVLALFLMFAGWVFNKAANVLPQGAEEVLSNQSDDTPSSNDR